MPDPQRIFSYLTIRPRWRKIFSDLWDYKSRTLLVITSIAIGIFAIGMISGAYTIIQEDMSASYEASNPANIELRLSNFDQELVNTIRRIPGVMSAEGRRVFSVRARLPGHEWVSLDLVAIHDFKKIDLNYLKLIDGVSIAGKQEIIFEKRALENLPIQIGGFVDIELPNGSTRSLAVAGVVRDQTTSAGDFLASPLAFISMNTLERLSQPNSFNRLYVTVADKPNDEKFIRSISEVISDKLEKSGFQIYRTRLSLRNQHPMASTVQAILGVLGALGILVLFLSSSLIANTLNALLNQHTRHIGIMKLIGGSSSQILGMYITLIFAFSSIALLISIPLGTQAAYQFSLFIASQLNFSILKFRIIPSSVIIQILVGTIVPLGAGFIPVLNGSRITVLAAVSGESTGQKTSKQSGPIAGESSKIPLTINRRLVILPRPMILSLRNTFRRKGRLALTLFTLTMGGAIFIAVFNVRTTLRQFIDQVGHYFLADVTMSFTKLYRLDEISELAKQVPGVIDVEGWSFASGEIQYADGTPAENLVILAPPSSTKLVDPILIKGRWLVPGDQEALAISEAIWKRFPGLLPGDDLRLKINGHEHNWKVVGIFKFVDREGIIGYSNYDYISNLLSQTRRSVSFRVVLNQHNKDYQTKLSADLDHYFRSNGYQVSQIEPGYESLKTASEGLDVLVTFLMIMALLTASVGSMGLTGTMSMNVIERTREIGIMRSIGAVDREVFKTVIIEGVLIGLISWVLGAILSFPISALLSYIISLAIFNTPLTPSFTLEGFFIWLCLVILLSSLASILPAQNATHLTIREVLSYE